MSWLETHLLSLHLDSAQHVSQLYPAYLLCLPAVSLHNEFHPNAGNDINDWSLILTSKMTDEEDFWRPALLFNKTLHFPLNDVQCFQIYPVRSGGQNVERANCAQRGTCLFSHTQKNQDSIDRELVSIQQTSSTSVMTLRCSFFFSSSDW